MFSLQACSVAGTDKNAGARLYDVGFSGKGQWAADINGDGRADYVYNQDGSNDYRILKANNDFPYGTGLFGDDSLAGSRNADNNVGYDGDAQWMADVNGDGKADYVYNRDNTEEYWVMLGKSDGTFDTDTLAGSRDEDNDVGYDGKAQWMADVNGDGRADYVYNRDKKDEYWVMLAKDDGTFEADKLAGSRDDNNDVGYDGDGEWMADVNGDGRADYVYNRNNTREYWVMLAKSDGTFEDDQKAGSRDSNNNVGYSGEAQWLIDVTGDGAADYVYNRDNTHEYWVMVAKSDGTFAIDQNWGSRGEDDKVGYGVNGQGFARLNSDGLWDFLYNKDGTPNYRDMLSLGDSFKTDTFWGARTSNNNVGWDGAGSFLADVNGDGLDDLVYDRDNTKEVWVLPSIRPAALDKILLLDVWGEGFIRAQTGTSGFQDSYNLNKNSQPVSSGPNMGLNIPSLVSVENFDNPVFPISDGAVSIMTLMNAPIVRPVAEEMYRTLEKNQGVVILYGDVAGLDVFESVFITQHGFVDITSKATLNYPFNQITTDDGVYRVYASTDRSVVLSLGKGGQVGGVGCSGTQENQFSGGGVVHDEL
jgi:hypothetical protein